MAEQPSNILWMAEEIDFDLEPAAQTEASSLIQSFLDSAGNPELSHRIVRPADSIHNLRSELEAVHATEPITAVVDLTRGKMSHLMGIDQNRLPVWDSFSMSRVRVATKPELPTSGHAVSHNTAEIREVLGNVNTDHVLILDDTSFSGSTSVLIEGLIRKAFPDRELHFTHGFLLLNTGDLGPNPGPRQRIEALGSRAVGGIEIHTPQDDGWHFFDIVKNQGKLPEHLAAVMGLVQIMRGEQRDERAKEFLSNQDTLRLVFPNIQSTPELERAMSVGHFISAQQLNGDLHTRNPQLLPNIIGQGHLLPPEQWREGVAGTLLHLEKLAKLLDKSGNE